ncbi:hypothetical protein AMTR_s00028p00148980 [Amborella trichopoda]|uniref:Uncharacterized protein n=1 Tax=Amborella trichopoda TaxID=13333 RepID=W1PTJ1_AMBTC|nr:hypothetical protein AMTR_s00028p00148980 [Amborella trichopoda]
MAMMWERAVGGEGDERKEKQRAKERAAADERWQRYGDGGNGWLLVTGSKEEDKVIAAMVVTAGWRSWAREERGVWMAEGVREAEVAAGYRKLEREKQSG